MVQDHESETHRSKRELSYEEKGRENAVQERQGQQSYVKQKEKHSYIERNIELQTWVQNSPPLQAS